MGLTKQYLRFVPGPIFGIISSAKGNVSFVDFQGKKQTFVAVPACENVLIWNYRTGECVHVLPGDQHSVTCLVADKVRYTLAVGYTNGTVKVFNLNTGQLIVSFCGHKSPVSCLAYDELSHRLASGGKDTEIVLWDIVGECGLFRMVGHKGPITNCRFLTHHNILITSSEDTLLKFWHLDSRRCFKTVVGFRGEIWDFEILNNQKILASVNEKFLRVWDLKSLNADDAKHSNDFISDDVDTLDFVDVGNILMGDDDAKIVSIGLDPDSRVLACHGYSKTLLVFKLLTQEESLKKLIRERKEKKQTGCQTSTNEENGDLTITLSDKIEEMKPIQTEAKIISFDMLVEVAKSAKVVVLLNNNSFSVYNLDLNVTNAAAKLLYSIKSGGHRSGINTVSFNSDGYMLLSGSNDSIKIWNRDSQICTHTFKCEPVFCSLFVTGDNHCVVGTKAGELKIFELTSHQLIETVEAHESAVSDLAASPDQRSITSGSADKDVKFWNYELVKDSEYSETKKRLTLLHTRTLKMSEEILRVKYSPNQKFIAVSLLDCTVKVLFCDTLKLAFSLYGHKLPISCIDISYDSTLLVSGSKDKNIKIWSLEFGNCLKSIFAHSESITCLQFIPKTHMIFTAGKDKKVKQWDCDNFRKIITLEGHQSKICALSVSPDGKTVLTGSHDRSLRLWEKTSEPLILEEEEENEREQELDKQFLANEPAVPGETNKEVGLATRTTIESLKTAEQLIEAIEIFKGEVISLREHRLQCKTSGKDLPPPTPNPMLIAYSTTCPYRYMLKMLQRSRSSTLEGTLLRLPFNYAVEFLKVLAEFVKRRWELELTTRCVLFLVRVHLCQIMLCKDMLPVIEQLQSSLVGELTEIKDIIGSNTSGLKFLQKQVEDCEEVCFFADTMKEVKRKGRKRSLIKFV